MGGPRTVDPETTTSLVQRMEPRERERVLRANFVPQKKLSKAVSSQTSGVRRTDFIRDYYAGL